VLSVLLKRKLETLADCEKIFSKAAKIGNTEASHVISYHTAYAGEAHTNGENLIKPCAVEMEVCV
jgi:hypothetical protein